MQSAHVAIRQQPPLWITSILLLSSVLFYVKLLWLPSNVVARIGVEDGAIENIGALAYLIAALLCLLCFRESRSHANLSLGRRTSGDFYFILLGAFFFLCAGEEVSWGQRIFDWETPNTWSDLNAQKETNVHNLWLFQGWNPDGSAKGQLELLLHPGRIITMFWVSYCIVLPILYVCSTNARRLLDNIGLPVPIMFCGLLFLTSYLARKLIVEALELPVSTITALNELQETSFAVYFAVMATCFVKGLRLDRNGSQCAAAAGALPQVQKT